MPVNFNISCYTFVINKHCMTLLNYELCKKVIVDATKNFDYELVNNYKSFGSTPAKIYF